MINRIGYTQDGLVFLVIDGEFEGKKVQTITQMAPDVANRVSMAISQAATQAKEKLGERDSPNFN